MGRATVSTPVLQLVWLREWAFSMRFDSAPQRLPCLVNIGKPFRLTKTVKPLTSFWTRTKGGSSVSESRILNPRILKGLHSLGHTGQVLVTDAGFPIPAGEIGRASCRERGERSVARGARRQNGERRR